MRIIHDDFKKACKNTGKKVKEGFKGLVKPFKKSSDEKIVKLQSKIEKLRKENK